MPNEHFNNKGGFRQEGETLIIEVGGSLGGGANVEAYELGSHWVGLIATRSSGEREILERRKTAILEVMEATSNVEIDSLKQDGLLPSFDKLLGVAAPFPIQRVTSGSHISKYHNRDMLVVSRAQGTTLSVLEGSDFNRIQLGAICEEFLISSLNFADRIGIASALLLTEKNLMERGSTIFDVKATMVRFDLLLGSLTIVDPGFAWIGHKEYASSIEYSAPIFKNLKSFSPKELWKQHKLQNQTGTNLAKLVTSGLNKQDKLAGYISSEVTSASSPEAAALRLLGIFFAGGEFESLRQAFEKERVKSQANHLAILQELAVEFGYPSTEETQDDLNHWVEGLLREHGHRLVV